MCGFLFLLFNLSILEFKACWIRRQAMFIDLFFNLSILEFKECITFINESKGKFFNLSILEFKVKYYVIRC